MKNLTLRIVAFLFLLSVGTNAARAQEGARSLLALVPEDFGIALAAHDLRGQFDRWQKSAWVKKIQESSLVRTLERSAEWNALIKLKRDLHTHLEVDWPTLRDEILGDAIVLAYRSGSADGIGEEGLLLIKARKGELLSKLMERLNVLQKNGGKLKALDSLEQDGVKYHRRVHDKSTQYYFVRDGLLVLTGQEATLKELITRVKAGGPEKAGNLWTRSFEQGAAPRSFLTILVNPRAFDAEIKGAGNPGPDAYFRKKFGELWQALDAMVLNARWEDALEVRLSIHGKAKDTSAAAKRLFRGSLPNPLWAKLPQQSILTLTGQVDLTLSEDSWGDLLPLEFRKQAMAGLQKTLGAFVGVDLEKDLLPHIGPDWGMCVFASENPTHVPQGVFAIAARSGPKEPYADQALVKGLQFLSGLAVFDYNRHRTDPIRIQTVRQGKVEVKTFICERTFPDGFQPSFALKDGYLVIATSPEGILRFGKEAGTIAERDDNLTLRLSATELSKQLTLRRDFLTAHIAKSNGIPQTPAAALLDGVQQILELFDRVELSHSTGRDQMTLILRVTP